ncbi:hypothetical protein [Endozoicomonas sp.]|uniref:hypothetical protein n=1 Tax=Endozoicomonas sp. TaxID=1892382 RepID=UPI002888F29F|nr:hypothetical protein [Endozoicomonas sp.]
MGLPKLSAIITELALPLYGKDASEGEMKSVLNIVCGCWNLGPFSEDDRAKLRPLLIAPWLDHFVDPGGKLKEEVDRIIQVRATDHVHDPRFILNYKLEPFGDERSDKRLLQIVSFPMPPTDFKSAAMKNLSSAMEA